MQWRCGRRRERQASIVWICCLWLWGSGFMPGSICSICWWSESLVCRGLGFCTRFWRLKHCEKPIKRGKYGLVICAIDDCLGRCYNAIIQQALYKNSHRTDPFWAADKLPSLQVPANFQKYRKHLLAENFGRTENGKVFCLRRCKSAGNRQRTWKGV